MDQAFDDGVRASWRKPDNDPQQRAECEMALHPSDATEFDRMSSEEGIRRLFDREGR